MKKLFLPLLLLSLFLLLFCSRQDSALQSTTQGSFELNLSSQVRFSGNPNLIPAMRLWQSKVPTTLSKTSANAFKEAKAISLSMTPFLKAEKETGNDSAFNCEWNTANAYAFAGRTLNQWSTLVNAFKDFNLWTVTDTTTLSLESDGYANGHIKINSGWNIILILFISADGKISKTSVAEYVYMDETLTPYAKQGTWNDGFITKNGTIWTSGDLIAKDYASTDYPSFSAYTFAGLGILGLSPSYADYRCAHPDTLTDTTGNNPGTGTGLPTWKTVTFPESLTTGAAGKTAIAFRSLSDTTPVVAVIDQGSSDTLKLFTKKNNEWQLLKTTPAGVSDFVMAVSDSMLFLVFTDSRLSNRATLWTWDGQGWDSLSGFTPGSVSAISLSFIAYRTPSVAFSNGANSGKVAVMNYNSSSHSFTMDTLGLSSGSVLETALTTRADATRFLAIKDQSRNGEIRVFRSGTTWTITDSIKFVNTPKAYALSLVCPDSLLLLFRDTAASGTSPLLTWNGATNLWENGISVQASNQLKLSTSFNPLYKSRYIAFADARNGNKATVMQSSGPNSSWTVLEKTGVTSAAVTELSLALSGKEIPWMVYRDTGKNNKISLLRYSNR